MAEALKSTPGAAIAAPNTPETLYTAPVGVVDVTIVNIIVINPGASVAVYSVHHVPSAGSPSDANKIVHKQPIDIDENQSWDNRIFLAAGDTIQAESNLAGVVFKLNYLERT